MVDRCGEYIQAHYDTSGVYTDQISCSTAQACYNDDATNATSWAAGTQKLLEKMVEKMGPEKVLISESIDQTMMGELSAFLVIYGWSLEGSNNSLNQGSQINGDGSNGDGHRLWRCAGPC